MKYDSSGSDVEARSELESLTGVFARSGSNKEFGSYLFMLLQVFEMCFTSETVSVCCDPPVDAPALALIAPLELPVPEVEPVI